MIKALIKIIQQKLWIHFVYTPKFMKEKVSYPYLFKQKNIDFLFSDHKMPESFLRYLLRQKIIAVIDDYNFCQNFDEYLKILYTCAFELTITLSDNFGIDCYKKAIEVNSHLKNLFISFLQSHGVSVNSSFVGTCLNVSTNQVTFRLAINSLGLCKINELDQRFKESIETHYQEEIDQKYRHLELKRKSKLNRRLSSPGE